MATWTELSRQAPDLAAAVRCRFEAQREVTIATLRRDGSPRISGIETWFDDGELWVGSMPASRKGEDLLRDPRCALHSATGGREITDGDAKLSGRAAVVSDPAAVTALLDKVREATGQAPAEALMFRLDLLEASFLRVEGNSLVIDSWRDGQPPRRRTRS